MSVMAIFHQLSKRAVSGPSVCRIFPARFHGMTADFEPSDDGRGRNSMCFRVMMQ
jgi:hypothetical protein